MSEKPIKMRITNISAQSGGTEPDLNAAVLRYVKPWVTAVKGACARHRYEELSERLLAVGELTKKMASREPAGLARLAPGHPAAQLRRALEQVHHAIELHQQLVSNHELGEWGEWRQGAKDGALAALRTCVALPTNATDPDEVPIPKPGSELAWNRSAVSIAHELLTLLEGE